MEVLHKTENPSSGVSHSLLETIECRSLASIADSVPLHAGMRKFTLFGIEPASRQGSIWEQPEAKQCDHGGGGTLDNE